MMGPSHEVKEELLSGVTCALYVACLAGGVDMLSRSPG